MSNAIIFKIYGLVDPITHELRYVGQTKQATIRRRFSYHITEKVNNRKNQWIRSLIKKGTLPEIFLIDECKTIDDCNYLEEFWIGYFKSVGCRLTNVRSGGMQSSGHKLSKERIAEIVKRLTGKKCSDQTKDRISKANKNNPQLKATMSKIAKNRPKEKHLAFHKASRDAYLNKTPEEKKAIYSKRTEGMRARGYLKHPPEVYEKIANKLRGKKRPKEVMDKIHKSNIGRKHSAEWTKNYKKGMQKHWDKKKDKAQIKLNFDE